MRRDIASAYFATAAKILAWVIVAGLLYRVDTAAFAMLALVRGTIGILNYTTLGLSPAMIRMLAESRGIAPANDSVSYFNAKADGTQSVYANGSFIALVCGAIGITATIIFAKLFIGVLRVPSHLTDVAPFVVALLGSGTVLRLMSDAAGSVLQAHGRIASDNLIIASGEMSWALLSLFALRSSDAASAVYLICLAHALTGMSLLLVRDLIAARISASDLPRWRLLDDAMIRRLLSFGVVVLFAQLADYLYAPVDYILINLFIGWDAVATYTPAMTIDSGLLLLVGGLSTVILPRSALAHTAGDIHRVRRYYVYGTLASLFLLLFAACVLWLLSSVIFTLWLGDAMPATQRILPLVLIHTIVGGSSAVGRSVLLGMGKVKPFTIAVLIAGVSNVVLSYIFVRHLNLGLNGIIYGTILVVIARCAIWMPWYTLRSLR